MGYFLKGALIEYGSDFLGPLPNVVLFQFNPEKLTRNIQIPRRPVSGANQRETSQAGEATIEKITLQARFSAADQLAANNPLARTMGVGPRLAALEKMVHPSNKIGGLIGAAIDAVGDAISSLAGGDDPRQSVARQPVPRQAYPRIIFIWGPLRVLPVVIESMNITELQYDFVLNPTQADVDISLAVNPIDSSSDDLLGRGALEYSNLAKEAQAVANLANTIDQVVDLIPF
ncbi:MAG TPA: hypothetical protein VFX96_09620 [Pyrinomonadaceae bacterium]|nr:hypothetical protein [Pyrinomonadaceae bacterium]